MNGLQVLYSRQMVVGGAPINDPDAYSANFSVHRGLHTVPSIFLVGPTPRDHNTPSWRPAAIRALRKEGFKGLVISPEDTPGQPDIWKSDHGLSAHERERIGLAQIFWEWTMIGAATTVACWIPRELTRTVPLGDEIKRLTPSLHEAWEFGFNMEKHPFAFQPNLQLAGAMPALTTNYEVAMLMMLRITRGVNMVIGAPKDAQKMGYLQAMCKYPAHLYGLLAMEDASLMDSFRIEIHRTLTATMRAAMAITR